MIYSRIYYNNFTTNLTAFQAKKTSLNYLYNVDGSLKSIVQRLVVLNGIRDERLLLLQPNLLWLLDYFLFLTLNMIKP